MFKEECRIRPSYNPNGEIHVNTCSFIARHNGPIGSSIDNWSNLIVIGKNTVEGIIGYCREHSVRVKIIN